MVLCLIFGKSEYLIEYLEQIGANVYVEQIHSLADVITADFQTISYL